MNDRKIYYIFWVFVVFCTMLYGCPFRDHKTDEVPFCAPADKNRSASALKMNGFVLVRPGVNDDFNSLAARFLQNESKGWLIARFNRQQRVLPGKPLIIPQQPVYLGGVNEQSLQAVPVLVYHQFAEDHSDKMTIKAEDFYEQMLWLKKNGYAVISLDQLLDFMDFEIPLPEKSVVITIDDGWRSVYDLAYPILKKFGFQATLFVYTDFIGGEKALQWSYIEEMAQNGFDVQSHTLSHRNLTMIGSGEPFEEYFKFLVKELEGSKKLIEEYLNSQCRYLAYPFGETNELVTALAKKTGYRAAFTVRRGSTQVLENRYTVPRSVIYGDAGMDEFIKNVSSRKAVVLK